MIDMFETFCIRTHEAYTVDIPFSNIMGGRFNLDFALSYAHSKSGDCTNCQLGQIPMYHMHYQRTNCVDLQYSIRLYYQKRVDYLVHKLMSCFDRNELQANATLICSALSQYPSPEEISHLLRDSSDYQEIFPFDDPSYAQQRSTVFVELKKKIWNAYRGTFKTESSLVRAIDKCIRRYIHLFVVAQPHMTRHNSYIFMSLERVIYKNCASFIYCINLTLLPHVCSLVKYRMERCLLASKTNSQHPCMTDSFEKIQQQFDHIFNQLNFLNEPLLLP
ncbi:hypothetical protein C9374_007891 [Naegleria lovaniensis]|uniref:Uncharacterized protein n=1 Tax=Naegleria lovaniensis TaxID=51637 RepID=A0AA88GM51_NAELO|nr:uncharacterized protein C9374_007891 [Naegleria lovaniensis]KAG2378743.1 hypothetical protein C9374_007891 [Naegleria lovaniensis]